MDVHEYYYMRIGEDIEDDGIETWIEEDGLVEEYWNNAIDSFNYIEYIYI